MKSRYFSRKFFILVFTAVFCFSSVAGTCSFESRASIVDNRDIVEFIYKGLGHDYNKIKDSYVYAYNHNLMGVKDFIDGPANGSISGRPGILSKNLSYYHFPTKSSSETVDSGGARKNLHVSANTGTRQNSYPGTTTNNNYNQVENRTAVSVESSFNSTTNNYDYSYKVYNPVTNNYFTTNNYTYNTTYNTYNFVTNNYNYTTNYYIQDNRTYISYYIINVNNETGEVEDETYTEMYYKLPDGRSSYNLKASDLKGVYFPGRFTKYVSHAEDDGTTLGLWHLDGDLKDSSFWGNSSGTSYTNKYTDGYWGDTLGKSFSDNTNDYMKLSLDRVNLPSTWTLEWYEYVPEFSFSTRRPNFPSFGGDYTSKDSLGYRYYSDKYNIHYDVYFSGVFGIDGSGVYLSSYGSFVPYAVVCNNGEYSFYRNGALISPYTVSDFSFTFPSYSAEENVTLPSSIYNSSSFSGISVTEDFIKFYTSSEKLGSYKYVADDFHFDNWNDTKCYSLAVFHYYFTAHRNAVIDEVRLSAGALYTGDSYVPSSQPFTTNTVLTVPDDPEENEIAFFTNTDIADVRFGGVRPTYPTNGYVYVHLDDDENVDSVQQFQQDGWYEIEASIYYNDSWELLKGFDLSYISIDPGGPEEPDNPDKPDPDNPDKPDPDNPDKPGTGTPSEPDKPGIGGDVNGLLESVGKFFTAILNGIVALLKPLVDGLASLVGGIADGLASIVTLMGGSFSGFLTEAFAFIPEDIVNVIVLGVSLAVLVSLIRIFRG